MAMQLVSVTSIFGMTSLEDFEHLSSIERLGSRVNPRTSRPRPRVLDIFTDTEFKQRFRFSKQTFHHLLEEFGAELSFTSDRNNPVSSEIKLLLTLRFYAANTFQIIDGDSFGVHQTSACRIVHRVSDVIARSAHRYVKSPSQQEFQDIAHEFYRKSGFPGIVGVLDGTHIRIQAPPGPYSELYRNRKDYFSINAQIMCDPDLRIRNLVTRWYGSAHDARIFNESALRTFSESLLTENYLLGDSGYGCSSGLLTPFLHPANNAEEAYNNSHRRARNTIERCIGVWKRRFTVLKTGLRVKLERCPAIITATAVLHNIALSRNEAEEFEVEEFEAEEFEEDNADNETRISSHRGNVIRNFVVSNYFSG